MSRAPLFTAMALMSCSPPPSMPRCATTALPSCETSADRYTDEACARLEDAEGRSGIRTDAMLGPIVMVPAEGSTVPSATPLTFRWQGQLMAQRGPRGGSDESSAGHAAPIVMRRPPSLTFWDRLRRSIEILPLAHAHCAPFTGIGYALTFRSGSAVVARAELSLTEFTPGATMWDALRRATQPLDLTITAARFRLNEVSEGPVTVGAPRRFTIAP